MELDKYPIISNFKRIPRRFPRIQLSIKTLESHQEDFHVNKIPLFLIKFFIAISERSSFHTKLI